jgi:hypothetical protein
MVDTYDICLAVPNAPRLPQEVLDQIDAARPAILAELVRRMEDPSSEELRLKKIREQYIGWIYKRSADTNANQKKVQWARMEDLTPDDIHEVLVLIAAKERRRAREREWEKESCRRPHGRRRGAAALAEGKGV